MHICVGSLQAKHRIHQLKSNNKKHSLRFNYHRQQTPNNITSCCLQKEFVLTMLIQSI